MHTIVLLPLDATGADALTRTRDVVRALEDAGVDAVALLPGSGRPALEPVTAAAALARLTHRIGVLAADPVAAGFPYNTARRLASLDHVGDGRTGWFARGDGGAHDSAFVGVVRDLWATWEPGAQVPDKSTGDFHDDTRIHRIDPPDPHYRVRGPLDTPPTPWGPPLLVADGRARVPGWADTADLVVVEGEPADPREFGVVPVEALPAAAAAGVRGVAVPGVLDLGWAGVLAAAGVADGGAGPLRTRFGLSEVLV
jgi:alkanesulfonate monooxygenase SsuD/methylene tetrahydromethanopterin reductase-like flavin-dependent oxidoreductase (luciferase family)